MSARPVRLRVLDGEEMNMNVRNVLISGAVVAVLGVAGYLFSLAEQKEAVASNILSQPPQDCVCSKETALKAGFVSHCVCGNLDCAIAGGAGNTSPNMVCK
jgi:hypothetical protein